MHSKSNAQRAVEPDGQQLELVNYGAGYAWLRPEEPRYVLTELGCRELAMAFLFDRCPTVAETYTPTPIET